ncbi:hypothetical protein DF018_19525 [Burkholderia cenocepacia]|nr:hypothetical protein DF018_19525 [Burkholderia cenocepacia]
MTDAKPSPDCRTAEPPNRRTAEPPNRRTAEPPNRRTGWRPRCRCKRLAAGEPPRHRCGHLHEPSSFR